MEVISVNAESKIINLAASIGRSPQSWRGWYCVQVSFQNMDENLQHECLFWIKSFIESYLKRAEGCIYFCENNSIHILCKNISIDILRYAGEEICNLTYSESSVQVCYNLYDFSKDAMVYVENVLEKRNSLFQSQLKNIKSSSPITSSIPNKLPVSGHHEIKTLSSASRVMLVEDDPVTRWIVRNTLKNKCDLFTAATASKVFAQYTAYQPDVVFLDIDLPDHNGYEVLQWILRNDPGACVVMFSSNDYLDNIVQAIENGARGFIGKPFVKEQLLNYIS